MTRSSGSLGYHVIGQCPCCLWCLRLAGDKIYWFTGISRDWTVSVLSVVSEVGWGQDLLVHWDIT